MTVQVAEFDGSPEEWDDFVATQAVPRFSHQYRWLQLVEDVYGGEPHYFVAYEGDQTCGVLPVMLRHVITAGRVLISVPLADEAGVLADSPDAEEALIEAAHDLAVSERAAYLELRQRREPSQQMQLDLSRVGLELELPADAEELWNSFKAKVRNQVRKADKSGLHAIRESDVHAAIADALYPVYSENTRDLGSPMHAERFFHEVADRFPEAAHVVVVRERETVVGSALALAWRDTFSVPWASSLRRYFDMCPNNLLYWELMRLAIDEGCQTFDFGRSPRDSGTYRFKQQWGAEPVQLYYCYDAVGGEPNTGEKRDSFAYQLFSSVWRKTPLPIARALGPKIFARLPI